MPAVQQTLAQSMSQQAAAASQPASRTPMLWGIVVGMLQAATPLVIWWLDSATVYASKPAVFSSRQTADCGPAPLAGSRHINHGRARAEC